jgi:glycerate kinase
MKGSLSAFHFADIAEKAFLEASTKFKTRKVPVADGGDLTGEIIAKALNAAQVGVDVQNPVGKTIQSRYFVSGRTAIIEMADASGMKLIGKSELNPMKTSSFGTGELIADAVNRGCNEILLAIGGSATVDGGMGMLEALGFRFSDKTGVELKGNGKNLEKVADIAPPAHISNISIKIICDVDNPLLGKNGAAAVFGPQKGATPEMVVRLEKGLKNWRDLFYKKTLKDLANIPGTGAAGGISIPLLSFFNAEIVQGAGFVLSLLNFEEHIKWCDAVITGEGKIDAQTLNNKAPFVVSIWAKKHDKPVFAIGGSVEKEAAIAFDGIYSIMKESMDVEFAMKNAERLLYGCVIGLAGELVKERSLKK